MHEPMFEVRNAWMSSVHVPRVQVLPTKSSVWCTNRHAQVESAIGKAMGRKDTNFTTMLML